MSGEAGEGVSLPVPALPPSGAGVPAESADPPPVPPPPPAGSFWNLESVGGACPAGPAAPPVPGGAPRCRGTPGLGRRPTVAYVINEASPGPWAAAESEALQSLREACEAAGAGLETLHFGKLDFGETAVLDRFYNADEACLWLTSLKTNPESKADLSLPASSQQSPYLAQITAPEACWFMLIYMKRNKQCTITGSSHTIQLYHF